MFVKVKKLYLYGSRHMSIASIGSQRNIGKVITIVEKVAYHTLKVYGERTTGSACDRNKIHVRGAI